MAYTTIDDPSEYFTTTLYTGNGSSIDVTNSANSGNFAPDWLWIKERSATSSHIIFDTNRPVSGGFAKHLHSNETAAEAGDSSELTAFGSNGFSYGSDGKGNQSSQTYVAWQWKANGGTTSSNTDGSITSTVQANTTAGFSIVTYTGTGSAATLGHGLGSSPEVVIAKSRSQGYGWIVYHKAAASDAHTDYLGLDDADALIDFPMWNDTAPTSTVFSVGTDVAVNNNTKNYVAYCFAEKQGYSKFGSYTGNGNADGAFVHTGFRPAWIMGKRTSGGHGWFLFDDVRDNHNPTNQLLEPHLNNAETNDSFDIDILSNGFKLRGSENTINGSGESYIYMAFARHPFVSSKGVPTPAR